MYVLSCPVRQEMKPTLDKQGPAAFKVDDGSYCCFCCLLKKKNVTAVPLLRKRHLFVFERQNTCSDQILQAEAAVLSLSFTSTFSH